MTWIGLDAAGGGALDLGDSFAEVVDVEARLRPVDQPVPKGVGDGQWRGHERMHLDDDDGVLLDGDADLGLQRADQDGSKHLVVHRTE